MGEAKELAAAGGGLMRSLIARAPARLRETRGIATVVAALLVMLGLVLYFATPPTESGLGPDLREIPGQVESLIQSVIGGAKPEAGYPRIKIDHAGIDLLLVKGDGKTPPVRYEAFTFPGADHLLDAGKDGKSNSYVYGHARPGMFWNLHNLHIGDVVAVDYGGGKLLRYRVAEIHPKVSWKDFEWLQPTADNRLTLQTCNGWRDEDPRFIVVARRIADQTALNQ
jgi:LPXTG-site transpeptidase (sortase) family protein